LAGRGFLALAAGSTAEISRLYKTPLHHRRAKQVPLADRLRLPPKAMVRAVPQRPPADVERTNISRMAATSAHGAPIMPIDVEDQLLVVGKASLPAGFSAH